MSFLMNISISFNMLLFFGLKKMFFSKKMIMSLISIEMTMLGSFYLFMSKWWVMITIHSIVFYLVIVVIEGVVGLLLLLSFIKFFETSEFLYYS